MGKSEYQILSAGRPSSISGGKSWKTTVKIPPEIARHNKYINIETGSGGLITILISAKTNVAFCVSYTPVSWATFSEVNESLRAKYKISDQGRSQAIKTSNSEYVSFDVEMWENIPEVNIYAVDIERGKYRFIE